jgi:hypothetical protein
MFTKTINNKFEILRINIIYIVKNIITTFYLKQLVLLLPYSEKNFGCEEFIFYGLKMN